MNLKLAYSGIVLLTAGTVGILFAVAMELVTAEPVYFTVMKVTALMFGLGGGLIGIASLMRRKG